VNGVVKFYLHVLMGVVTKCRISPFEQFFALDTN
jgi:hypothetical protein